MKSDPNHPAHQSRAWRVIGIGVGALAVAGILIGLPILIGNSSINRFLVAGGLLLFFWSLSCILHAAWDLWRGPKS